MHEIRHLRGRVPPPLRAGPRARLDAPVRRPGGGRGRRLRGAARRRHDDLHLPRPRRGPGDGRAAGPHVRRDPGQGRRALRRQGRLDAPDRRQRRRLGSFAIVGAHLPITVGAAFAARYRATGAVSLCFFGDGTTNIGAFHEALNLAAVWKLPVVFVCENNLYGEYSPLAWTTPIERLADRAAAYGMRAERIDGNDVLRGPRRRRRGRRARAAGEGPTLIEALTYRQRGPLALGSRPRTGPQGELEALARARPDPPARAGAGRGRRPARAARRDRATRPRGPSATRSSARWPGPTPIPRRGSSTSSRDRDDVPGGVNRAIADALEADDDVFLLGEDVGAAGGVFKTTEGLQARFGARPRARHADRRAGDRRHARSAPRCRACGRWPRSCSPTSRASASTRSPTSWRSTAT